MADNTLPIVDTLVYVPIVRKRTIVATVIPFRGSNTSQDPVVQAPYWLNCGRCTRVLIWLKGRASSNLVQAPSVCGKSLPFH